MRSEDCKALVCFLHHVDRLKKERRRGWITKVGIRIPESVADHSWRTALLALLVGSSKGLDTPRMVGMALIHDIGEALIGDLTPEDVEEPAKKRVIEEEAVTRLTGVLPPSMQHTLTRLWQEYRDGVSREAVLVRELDKVEMALQAEEYRLEGYDEKRLEEFSAHAEAFVKDKDLLSILVALRSKTS